MHFQPEGPVVIKVKDREAAGPPLVAGPARCLQGTRSLLLQPSSPACSAPCGPRHRPAACATSGASWLVSASCPRAACPQPSARGSL